MAAIIVNLFIITKLNNCWIFTDAFKLRNKKFIGICLSERTGKKENKLGMRASETTEMIFDNCRVPKENLLGKEGEGFKQAMQILDGGRISIAALSLGIAKGAFIAATNYAKERHQFGQAISNFQAIAFKLADMATDIEAAELLTHQAADMKNKGLKMLNANAFAFNGSGSAAPYSPQMHRTTTGWLG